MRHFALSLCHRCGSLRPALRREGQTSVTRRRLHQASIWVIRDGLEVKVDCVMVVRGDLVVLGTGDVVPADMRLIEADDVKVGASEGEP